VQRTAWRAPEPVDGTIAFARAEPSRVDFLIAFLALVLIALVVLVVSAPLRNVRRENGVVSPEQGELQAAREAKYREIRDAELDFRTGKLSREDYAAIDRTLRAEALEILNRLEASEKAPPNASTAPGRRQEG
jgi:flagellar biosynthesis/type III secretory pathway M-ring protein FliF/YscJ